MQMLEFLLVEYICCCLTALLNPFCSRQLGEPSLLSAKALSGHFQWSLPVGVVDLFARTRASMQHRFWPYPSRLHCVQHAEFCSVVFPHVRDGGRGGRGGEGAGYIATLTGGLGEAL